MNTWCTTKDGRIIAMSHATHLSGTNTMSQWERDRAVHYIHIHAVEMWLMQSEGWE